MPAKRPWRCTNPKCERGGRPLDFWAEQPVCPSCGIGRGHPRFGRLIQQLEVIHFDPPSEVMHFGQGHAACDTALKVGQVHATGYAPAVNCPECRKTAAWAAAREAAGEAAVDPGADFEVETDEQGVLRRRGEQGPPVPPCH